jgi:hypothetical protein
MNSWMAAMSARSVFLDVKAAGFSFVGTGFKRKLLLETRRPPHRAAWQQVRIERG